MTAVNFFLDTRCSAPTGTDGTLLHPSVKPPKRTITLRRITDQRDPFSEFHTNAHPRLVNYAFELLMEQEHTKQKPAPRHDQPER
mgnify:CR=1 FL=1